MGISQEDYKFIMKIMTKDGVLNSFDHLTPFGRKFVLCSLHMILTSNGSDLGIINPTVNWILTNTGIGMSRSQLFKILTVYVKQGSIIPPIKPETEEKVIKSEETKLSEEKRLDEILTNQCGNHNMPEMAIFLNLECVQKKSRMTNLSGMATVFNGGKCNAHR